MKLFAITAILVALYLMYRIAFQKQAETKKSNEDILSEKAEPDDVVGKSRPVSDYRRQPQPTPATNEKSENREENPNTFAPESKPSDAAIPPEELDEVFSQPMDIAYPLERETEEEPDIDAEEEAEELRQWMSNDSEVADGFTYEEMEQAVDAVHHLSDEKEAAAGRVLSGLEKTDMFEQLISGDAAKEALIKSVIDKHIRSMIPEKTENREDNNNEYGDFDIADFLG